MTTHQAIADNANDNASQISQSDVPCEANRKLHLTYSILRSSKSSQTYSMLSSDGESSSLNASVRCITSLFLKIKTIFLSHRSSMFYQRIVMLIRNILWIRLKGTAFAFFSVSDASHSFQTITLTNMPQKWLITVAYYSPNTMTPATLRPTLT